MGKIGLIARREFNERVKKKSFIFTTVLMPIAFVAMIGLVTWMSMQRSEKVRNIAVVDNSGIIAPKLHDEGGLKFQPSAYKSYEEVQKSQGKEELFAILVIGEDVMTNPNNVQFYTYEASTVTIESAISGQISKIIEDEKLKGYDIENLSQIMAEVKTSVDMQTKEITLGGETRDSSSVLSMMMAYLFGFLIYMFIFLYGNMVMQGVIEEKSNKVLELIVTSVKPFQLMMGKILGIASVAITQLVIWVAFIAIVGPIILNLLAGDMLVSAQAMSSGVGNPADLGGMNMEQAALLSRLTDVGYLATLGIGFLVYFIGGYLLYSAMFAAVGSAVDNDKDARNLTMPITIPLILAIFIMMGAMQDPHTGTAFWFSMIPFTSPVVMMARLPYGVPTWELILSIVLLYSTFVAMVWFAGKIYRVGIFMYGKKPTFKEIIKWARY